MPPDVESLVHIVDRSVGDA